MDRDLTGQQPGIAPNPPGLNQYLGQMEARVGQSQRTLHEILSHFLALKSQAPDLTREFGEVDLSQPEGVTPEQHVENRRILARLERLQKEALQGFAAPGEHPWQGLAHADLQQEQFEPLLRTLRFALIQFNKFWVEVQSYPVFLNAWRNASLQEIEQIFQWVLASPAWNDTLTNPRLVPELAKPESRKMLLAFARDAMCARALREQIGKKRNLPEQCRSGGETQEWENSLRLLSKAVSLAKTHAADNWRQAELESGIATVAGQLERVRRVQRFFGELQEKTGAPVPKNAEEAFRVLQTLKYLEAMPAQVRGWRFPQVLEPAQRLRMQAWQERARPVLEIRKRLETHFDLSACPGTDALRKLADDLKSAGWFRVFNVPYREALEAYRRLLLPVQGKAAKETRFQKAEKLQEWAGYLEQAEAFERNSEARLAFEPRFKGIDTDFAAANDANVWAAQIRSEVRAQKSPAPSKDHFGEDQPQSVDTLAEALISYCFRIPEGQLDLAMAMLRGEDAKAVNRILSEPEVQAGRPFAELAGLRSARLKGLQDLRATLLWLELLPTVALSELEETRELTEETLFLLQRMNSVPELRACLRNSYNGPDTDLAPIEQGLTYVKFIEASAIPDSIRVSLLSTHGAQRLADTRALVQRSLNSLALVHDHIKKLDVATHGQVRALADGKSIQELPMLSIAERIQRALKHPVMLPDWVSYLRAERDAREAGLSPVLGIFEKRSSPYVQLETAYEVAFNAALLKTALGQASVAEIRSS